LTKLNPNFQYTEKKKKENKKRILNLKYSIATFELMLRLETLFYFFCKQLKYFSAANIGKKSNYLQENCKRYVRSTACFAAPDEKEFADFYLFFSKIIKYLFEQKVEQCCLNVGTFKECQRLSGN
jgi:hypothetical protein